MESRKKRGLQKGFHELWLESTSILKDKNLKFLLHYFGVTRLCFWVCRDKAKWSLSLFMVIEGTVREVSGELRECNSTNLVSYKCTITTILS